MFILLPPSEGKAFPESGPEFDLEALSEPSLNRVRQTLIEALIHASAGGPAAIGAPASTTNEVEANTHLMQAPTAPAAQVYTGVLYSAAGLSDLAGEALARATEHVRIASTVFGFLTPSDPIPGYRLPPQAKLPEVGAPVAFLAPATTAAMETHEPTLVLDCRSGPYLRLWRPRCPWVHVKALQERNGTTVTVSHSAKHHRGILTRHLLTRSGDLPHSVEGVLAAARELVGTQYAHVQLVEGRPGTHVLELHLADHS